MANKLLNGVTLTLMLLQITHIIADCNLCSPSQVACVSDQEYAFCTNGTPNIQKVYNCPDGHVCSTFGAPICQEVSDVYTIQDCKSCKVCDVNKTFACTSQNTFALCLGQVVPSDKYTGSCAPDAVCNVNFRYICASPDDDGYIATCPKEEPATTLPPTTSTTSTTPAPITPSVTDPSAYCNVIQKEGRFPMGSNIETTCHQFVSCVQMNGIWRGAVYVCPADTYFDSSTKVCTGDIPPRCGQAVRSISLLDIELD